ncbi:MAG: DUF3108 domain-containing protein [Bacteroides sp.]|nr:DUF3108 domain-containing protein [Bacteroides sp.]
MKAISTYISLLVVGIIGLFGSALSSSAASFQDESLNYVISYKWGLIHKDAGEATLKLRNKGDRYVLTLTGKTKPWADKFFQVRDTLVGNVLKEGFKPLSYTKIAHEDGSYSRDDITYSYSGANVSGHSKKYRLNKKGVKRESQQELSATGATFDMLSVFYFLRTINYEELTSGKPIEASIFSGSKVETLTIRYVGKENLKLRNKSEREAYHIKFRFTSEGQKKSSDDLDAWISTDSSHIPLQIVGSLPVGQVKCYYMP